MPEVNLGQTYRDLANEITIGSAADGELKVTEFFRIFAGSHIEHCSKILKSHTIIDYCTIRVNSFYKD